MTTIVHSVLSDIGLTNWPPFLRDRLFFAALAIAIPVWGVMWVTVVPTFSVANESVIIIILSAVVWYPVLEEILFRGAIQGSLTAKSFAQKNVAGLTAANWLTSFLFVLAHFWYQPALWAVFVIFPSLIYGFFRDRYSSIYPSIILHSFYNGGFVALNIYVQ